MGMYTNNNTYKVTILRKYNKIKLCFDCNFAAGVADP